MTPRRRLILSAVLGVLLVAALIFALTAGGGSGGGTHGSGTTGGGGPGTQTAPTGPGGLEGAEIPGDVSAPPIELPDQYGRMVSLASLRGQPVLVTFLYSTCGGPCVLIAQQIRGALDELGSPVPVLVVSADPADDTPPSVRRFLARVSLAGRVYYLTGSRSQLRRIWRAYRVTPASAGAHAFAEHATVLLVDASGRERALYGPEQLTPEALAHDIRATGRPAHP